MVTSGKLTHHCIILKETVLDCLTSVGDDNEEFFMVMTVHIIILVNYFTGNLNVATLSISLVCGMFQSGGCLILKKF